MSPDDESWLDTGIPTVGLDSTATPGDTTDAEDVTVPDRPSAARAAEPARRRPEDLELRRALARGHFAAAVSALGAHDTDDGRRIAMREAARALALDPTLTGAADLVGHLMLEPPTHTPVEVQQP